MSIEPFKKKKVDKEDKEPTFFHNDLFIKASGAPEAKINGVGTTPEEKTKYEPTPPNYNEILSRMFEKEIYDGDFGAFQREYTLYANGPMSSRHYEDKQVIKVSLEEALRREFNLCKGGRHSTGFHVARTLEYIRQYIENKR